MKGWLLACVLLFGFAGSAAAADMPVVPYQPPLVRPLYSWTGCYIGVNMGGGAAPQSRVDTTGVFAPAGTSLGDMTARGVAGGGQLGCDYQIGAWVFGLQGLLDLSGMKGSDVLPTTNLVNNSFVQTFATVTGRVGYTVLPTLLVYAKGGAARAHDLYNVAAPTGAAGVAPTAIGPVLTPPGIIVALGSKSTNGWTAGFGAEWGFAHAPVSLSLEYNYLGFSSTQVPFISAIVPGQGFPIGISQKIHTVLFGINLHFFGGETGP
ncbi:MAG TPA: outer membrane beta-barrel protein [Xanthobacteraceae bacterium]|jgi:outer membrane immunogenic protein